MLDEEASHDQIIRFLLKQLQKEVKGVIKEIESAEGVIIFYINNKDYYKPKKYLSTYTFHTTEY